VRTKVGNGAVVDIGLDALAGTQADFRPELDLLAATWEGQQQDDVRVPAGKFIGCYKSDSSTPWGPWQAPSHICAHPSVPLSGVVRATPMDKPGVMELVNFGLTGAESEFP
jgi:hypothetical protein